MCPWTLFFALIQVAIRRLSIIDYSERLSSVLDYSAAYMTWPEALVCLVLRHHQSVLARQERARGQSTLQVNMFRSFLLAAFLALSLSITGANSFHVRSSAVRTVPYLRFPCNTHASGIFTFLGLLSSTTRSKSLGKVLALPMIVYVTRQVNCNLRLAFGAEPRFPKRHTFRVFNC